ncbi:PAS-domain containing protein [Sulfitobacter sp.]|uniref:PAS-domain containing protein n=1 Tax=Sulfitobacter sp. TaxID=1903071 RepID=UPI0030031D89
MPTVALSLFWILRSGTPAPKASVEEVPVIFFKDGVLEYANEVALARFPIVTGSQNWQDIHDILQPFYPEFPFTFQSGTTSQTNIVSTACEPEQRSNLQIDWRNNAASLTFHDACDTAPQTADIKELELLRQIKTSLPHAAWKTDTNGAVVWHNDAYLALYDRAPKGSTAEPLFMLPVKTDEQSTCRMEFKSDGAAGPEWFDVNSFAVDGGIMHHATSRTALIRAEEAQRDFVQTLAKTFAHLSIGLAIFNRDRQLALFNPALTDLTGLSISFLSPRPTLDSFFDALRENRRMPEPKNYKTWRQRMADLVSAAEIGSFEESWTLETGQTYRVKGRPHPDGAIAFLIEDISAEVSLTRNFRAELELGQNLVDTFEDALAVFSQSGVLTFSNKAYDLLWGFEGESSFANVTITDAVRLWKEKSAPNPLWQDLQDAVMTLQDRTEWTMPVCLKGQTPMQCKIVPIASGATVVRFSRQAAVHPAAAKQLKNNRS